MKNKIIIFLALIIFFSPAVSRADSHANLTVTVNTEASDSSFSFELRKFEEAFLVKADINNLIVPKLKNNNVFVYVWQSIKYFSRQLINIIKPVFAFADESAGSWVAYKQFNIQTESLSGATTNEIDAPDVQYKLSQIVISGFKINSILCTSDNPSDAFFYQPDNVIFTPIENENITCAFNNTKEKTPVLIVPGVLGTEMKKGDELLWADMERMAGNIGDGFMDPILFSSGLTPTDSAVSISDVIKIKTFLGATVYNYTGGLINEFKNQGYKENENLFTFPYDWRYGLSGKFGDGATNADLLAKKIQDILSQTGAEKIDIVAHSMGGLIVKKYTSDHLVDNHIRKAVFIGVPNTGAPKAIKVLLQGDNFGIPWLSQDEMKKIAENLPAAYDLLPDIQYYSAKGSYVQVVEGSGLSNTEKDLNYEETKSFLTIDHNLNSQAIINSETLRVQDFDNFDLRTAGVDLYNIAGCKAGTLAKIIELRYKDILGNNQITYAAPKTTPGDNTVPLESAINLPVNEVNKYFSLKSDHGKMPSQNGIRQEIVNILSSSNLDVQSSLVTQDISKCKLNGKAISVFSAINIFITDQDGNRLGLAIDGSIINEIPNADFEILGDHKFIYLPTDDGQVYTITITSAGNGTFTITAEEIQNNATTKTEVFSNLSATLELIGSIEINSVDHTTILKLKQNSNSETQIFLADAVLAPGKQNDYFPPISVATLIGELSEPGVYKTEVAAKIISTDPFGAAQGEASGVLAVEYNLDNLGFQKVLGDTSQFTVSTEGNHTILFFSTDRAGNNEQSQTISFKIKFPPPPPPEPITPEPVVTGGGGGGGGAALNFINTAVNGAITAPKVAITENPPIGNFVPAESKLVIVKTNIKSEKKSPQLAVETKAETEQQPTTPAKIAQNPAQAQNQLNPFLASMGSFGYLSNINIFWIIFILSAIFLAIAIWKTLSRRKIKKQKIKIKELIN